MLLTHELLNNFFDDSFAIRRMNYMNYTDDVKYNEDGATIKMKVPGFNKKSIDISVDSEYLLIEGKTDDDSFSKRYAIDGKYDLDSIDASVHIYCEKTLVKGEDDVFKLVRAVQKNDKIIFQTGHQYHSSRLYSHIVKMIHSGEIGKVVAIQAQWNRNGNWRRAVVDPKLERQINWRMYREYSYGLLAELSSHQIDFCNWVLNNDPNKVAGFGGIDYWKDGRETYDNIHLVYTYPEGVKATFTCLTSNAKDDYQIKVMGDKATIIIDYQKAWKYPEGKYDKKIGNVDGVSGATSSWTEGKGNLINYSHKEPTLQALEDFRTAILENKQPLSDIKGGASVAFAVDMGIRAMDSEQVIDWDPKYNL